MSSGFDPSKRAFLRGRRQKTTEAPRLPWVNAERFYEDCTRCGDCLRACEEQIIVMPQGPMGDKTHPAVDFDLGECTFCGACAQACPEELFDRSQSPAWPIKAEVLDSCLTQKGVICQSCKEVCESRAIRFPPVVGGVSQPLINLDDCTGCGACKPVCPVAAIELSQPAPSSPS
ncbi:ferredoxin-type protein NapF [Rhodovibrionaceae bacterium A322]